VYQAITASDSDAIPVSAVSFMIRVASKLYDDFMDGDLADEWKESAAYEIFDTVMALSTLIPPSVIAELDVPFAARLEMQQLLFHSALQMLAGQEQDLANKNQTAVRSQDVESSIAGKSGAGIGMSAGLAGKMAGCSPEVLQAYMEFGRSLGILNLVVKDIYEMFQDPECRDLRQGTRTLQIVIAMEQMSETERAEFVKLLEEARSSETARNQVRRELRKLHYYYPCLEIVIRYKIQAKEALERANPKEPALTFLHVLLESQSTAI